MALSKIRNPRRAKESLQNRRNDKILYGSNIPASEADPYDVTIVDNIEKVQPFLLFTQCNTTETIILFDKQYHEMELQLDAIVGNTSYGALLCYNVIIRNNLDFPLRVYFQKDATLRVAAQNMKLNDIAKAMDNGISCLANRVIPDSRKKNIMRMNIKKEVAATVSSVFVTNFTGDNDEFLSDHD